MQDVHVSVNLSVMQIKTITKLIQTKHSLRKIQKRLSQVDPLEIEKVFNAIKNAIIQQS